MEYVEIVDKNGKFTGEVLDITMAHLKSLFHPAVIIFIVNSKGQVLLGKRSKSETIDGGKWALIGGHVDVGEAKEDAAKREIEEEIGIKINKDELMPIGKREVNEEKNNAHVIDFYYVKKDFDVLSCHLQKEEISAVRWFEIDDIIKAIQNNNQNIIAKRERIYLFEMLKNLE